MPVETSLPTIAVLGTGIIGAPVACNLARAGFPVRVWNRTVAKAEAIEEDSRTAVYDQSQSLTSGRRTSGLAESCKSGCAEQTIGNAP